MIRARPILIAALLPVLLAAERNQLTQDKQALAALQHFIGDWRGVGQLRRGSTRGAWREEAVWIWEFSDGGAALSFATKGGKYLKRGSLRPGRQPGSYQLRATTADGDQVKYFGRLDDQSRLVLLAADPPTDAPARLSLRQVARGDRLLVLYERQTGARYSRMAEVGYTRKGSNFGKGTSYVECVVTGGLGTIPVSFQGKTYYVCCSGCRDYFQENPAEVLAEYKERKKTQQAKEAETKSGSRKQ